jgi:hypothetical protein
VQWNGKPVYRWHHFQVLTQCFATDGKLVCKHGFLLAGAGARTTGEFGNSLVD